jgi:[acyl-carrier-protein] S-malonyltransferase
MAAILGLADAEVVAACEAAAQGDVVSAVNFNCPGQVVIAGQKEAVARGVEACKEAGAKRAVELPVSVPSHCALMRPAAEKLGEALNAIDVRMPVISLVHDVNAATAQDATELRDLLVRQLYSPVRWTESVQAMQAMGVDTLIECGPGKVLSGLNKKVDRAFNVANIGDVAGLAKALELLNS